MILKIVENCPQFKRCIILALLIAIHTKIVAQTEPFVKVNKNIELVSIAYFLADNGFSKNTNSYTEAVYAFFEKHKTHKAIVKLKSIINKKNADMSFVCLGDFIANDFTFSPYLMAKDDYEYYDELYGMNKISEFFRLLEEFKDDSNFELFYSNNMDLYNKWTSDFEKQLIKANTIETYQSYFKQEYSWSIILSPLYGGAHAIMRDSIYNMKHKTFIYGPLILGKNKNACVKFTLYSSIIWHEANHFLVSDYTYGLYQSKIDSIKHLFIPIKKHVKKNFGYDSWLTTFDEMLVNSITMSVSEGCYNGDYREVKSILLVDHLSKGLIYEYYILNHIRKKYNSNGTIHSNIVLEVIDKLSTLSIEDIKNEEKISITKNKKKMRKHWRRL